MLVAFTLLGLVGALQVRPANFKVKPAPLDTLRPPAWVLTGDTPRVGDIVEAWLIVPRYLVADTAASVTLLPPAIAAIWLRSESENCAAAEATKRQSVRGLIARDTILFACVRPADDGALRLVAVRRGLDAGGNGVVQRVAVSDPMVVAPWFTLSPVLAAVLSALGGFLAGFLGHIFRQWWDLRQLATRSVEQMKAAVVQALAPELAENLGRLERWTEAGKVQAPPPLRQAAYDQVLGDTGVVSFLEQKVRAGYWKGIVETYEAVSEYNDLNNGNEPLEKKKQGADEVLERLRKPAA